jgi:hypothetical protein
MGGWTTLISTPIAYCRLPIVLIALTAAASAHDWYPRECCHDVDCAPVERAEALADGVLRLTSRVGTTDVPSSFPRQPSPDGRMHICMVRYSHFDNMRPVCFFVPPAMIPRPS